MTDRITKTISIHATPAVVWQALTDSSLMKQWMAEPEIQIQIDTDWNVGSPINIHGFHHVKFVNRGEVLRFEPLKFLSYSHLSSLSRLADIGENHSVLEFELRPTGVQTVVVLTITNFPTESIYKHLDFYWTATMEILKKFIEARVAGGN